MRNVSNAFKQALEDGNRNYQCTAEIILTDNTQVTLTNANLLINGLSIKDNVSDDSDFTALGSVIVNAVEIRANNLSGTYSDYDFRDGIITIYVGLIIGTTVESIKIGTYIINEASLQKSVLSLYCLDYLSKFDKPYSNSTFVYPATLASILSNACVDCGVVLASTTFPNSTLTIATAPQANLTYREVVSFIATIAGCFTKCNANGQLVLQWFDSNAEHDLTALSSYDYSVSDITITGIKIITQTISESETTEIEHLFGTDDYIITIENNPFITESNVTTIGNYLVSQIAGLTFRIANISHLSDPTIEAGDVAVVTDRHGNTYNILITSTTFNVSSYQETKCSAVEPVEKTVTRFTEIQKTYATAKQLIKQEKTARQQMGQELTNAINAKAGMYETRVQESGGGYTYYLHDKPLLANSTAVIKVTNEAVAVTPDYQAATPTWYGLTVNGNFIANIMSTIGIDFDWGTGGTLTLGGANNGNGVLTVLDANNNSIGTWNNTGISLTKGSLRSADYVYGTGPYFCQSGMIVNFNNKTIMTPKFSVIDGVLMATDGIFSGQINAETGNIGGWTISKNYQITYTDSVTTGVASTQYTVFMRANQAYTPSTDTITPADSETRAFGVYHRQYNGSTYGDWVADFYVTHGGRLYANNAVIAGQITAKTGAIGGFVISSSANTGTTANGGHHYTNSLYVHSTGTEGGTNYEYEAGLTGNNSSTAANFYVRRIASGAAWSTSELRFYVRNDGYLMAITGKIGPWSMSETGIYKSGGYQSATAGSAYFGDSGLSVMDKFYVTAAGALTASDATITGSVTANSGRIGPWTISNDSIYYVDSTDELYIYKNRIYGKTNNQGYIDIYPGGNITSVDTSSDATLTPLVWSLEKTADSTATRLTPWAIALSANNQNYVFLGTSELDSHKYGVLTVGVEGTNNKYLYYDSYRALLTVYDSLLVGDAIRTKTIETTGNYYRKNNNYTKGTAPSSPVYSSYVFTDTNGETIGYMQFAVATNGNHSLQLIISTPTVSGGNTPALSLTKNASEVVTCRIAGATTVEGYITAELNEETVVAVRAKNSIADARIQVNSTGVIGVYNGTNGKWLIYMNTDTDPKPVIPQLATVTTTSAGNVFSGSTGVLYRNTSSSKRYKHDIKLLDDWKAILNIPVVSFIYNDGYLSKEDQRYGIAVPGFIAEDVYKYYPIAAERSDNEIEDWNTRFIIPPMLAVEQDHEKRIKELENEVYELKQLIAKLI